MRKNSVLILAVLIMTVFVFVMPGKIRAQQLQESEPQETELQTPEQTGEQPTSEQTETEETEEQQDSAEPEKVSGLKLNNSRMRQMTVTWQAVDGAAGYQVRYSYYKDFVRYKTAYVKENKAVLKKLKIRNKCYVMVRAYKGTKKAPIFGEFSAVKKKKIKGKLIVIDAGHQRHSDATKEPIGPGAKKKRKKVSGGTRGVSTKLYEYELTLIVAKKLQKALEKNGYQTVMIRTKHNVNISNSKRAAIANEQKADAFIRIHANGSTSHSKRGTFTICPTKRSPYPIRKLYKKCYKLSKCVVNSVCAQTKSKNLGIMQADDYTGINWCKVPVTLIEMGYQSNPTEDRLLAKSSYQDKIVQGILDGFDKYFKIKR
ncbi:MAG: N-acetylmuramoyl-L-alanine amidase [Lachnospiraceae bacterium]|nr:N-acetylmuramoyl-L-alanine amidase [Lachnospiraceae bacterium]